MAMTVTEMAEKLLADSKAQKVHPNMPVFLLYGSDPIAQLSILTWMSHAKKRGVAKSKILSAMKVVDAMSEWDPKKEPD